MDLIIYPYRLQDGSWAFDHDHNNTIGEGLINGTDKVLDAYFVELNLNGESPVPGDKLKVKVSTIPFFFIDSTAGQVIHTALDLVTRDYGGSTYIDRRTQREVWLCPWLQGYFGFVPKSLYVVVSR